MSQEIDLTVGIPADRAVGWTAQILSRLDKPDAKVEVVVSRWVEKPFTPVEVRLLNDYFPTTEVLSRERHAPAMRNAIVRSAQASHILFLDDDMVPDPDLLNNALCLIKLDPESVHQGIPYRVANPQSWLARAEGKLYEKGYRRYVDSEDNVTLLDARLILAPVHLLREVPFDESLVFGGGEGRELAKRLREKGVSLRLGRELDGAHINRDTIAALVAQKRAHGRGRGYMLLHEGPGEGGWSAYIKTYLNRHLITPAKDWNKGELDIKELMYVWGTYSVLWLGVIEEMMRAKIKPRA